MKKLADYTEEEIKEHIHSKLALPCMLTRWRVIQLRKKGDVIIDIAAKEDISDRTVKRIIKKHL